ncbi:MAG: calcium-translocating P-type ATPase, PMCA-type [Candidatus Onthomonas sp.]
MEAWHTMTPGQACAALKSDLSRGLSPGEVKLRLEKHGPNELNRTPKTPLLRRLWEQLRDPMILVLLAAAAVSYLASRGEDWLDTIIILLIVLVNAVISLIQESNAERALEALQAMAAPQARVIRAGGHQKIAAAGLVPGDLIQLEAGDYVPADARLVEAAGLRVDESAITGESVPVEKRAEPTLPKDTPLGDRVNLLIGSTVVTGGRATALVVATGMDTEVGRIAALLMNQGRGETPLQKKMGEISKTLSFVCLSACAVMFGVGLLQGKEMLSMFLIAVSLAVAAIPEGLPAIVTIVLAMGVQQMAGRNAIVKKLPAVETLGCASVICSDKTGTLTKNQMTVTQVWTASGKGEKLALSIGALCSDTQIRPDGTLSGDPTENAIVAAARDKGVDKTRLEQEFPRRAELPFDSERKLMSTIHPSPAGGYRVMVKGAPDVLLGRCSSYLAQGVRPLDGAGRSAIEEANRRMADSALRVIGLAYRELNRLPGQLTSQSVERDLIFVGLAGMIDPPRREVKAAVAECYRAGIRPVMITGDHKATAVAIARELDIFREGSIALTGAELDFMPPELLEEQAARCAVYARVSPEHKLRIVQALQKRGEIVAMTGDGVNDAPALKAADIGCAMGITGTDVAKGAADMVLTDDNFSTIVAAVEQGRGIYANIKKAVHYLLSCNIGEIVTIFLATVLNFHQVPLIPVQLLWLNLVTDSLPALALGVEPVEPGVMEQPPRSGSEPLFTPSFGLQLAWQGAMVGGLTLAAYFLGEYILSDPGEAYAAANTMSFATLTLCQLFHAFDVRSERTSLFRIGVFSNPAMNRAFLLGLILQLSVLLLPPLQRVFSVVPLSGLEWAAVLILSVLPVPVCEGVKWWKRRRGTEKAEAR